MTTAAAPTLRKLITFADEDGDKQERCSRISVRGDATYCIDGPVCGASADKTKGACPVKGDAAIGHCLQASRSFANGCIAPVDAHCVISAVGHWECVYRNTSSSNEASSATEIPGETTPAATQATSPVSLSAPSGGSNLALSATTQDTNAASESEIDKIVQAPNAALNVIVGASCCILALAGLVFVKKRRAGERPSGSTLSSSGSSSIMTL
jgi:hypothetical protein